MRLGWKGVPKEVICNLQRKARLEDGHSRREASHTEKCPLKNARLEMPQKEVLQP
jgi:hypothetical protein